MKTSPLPPCSLRSRGEGGALRVLVLCLGVLSLAVIGWLLCLPKNLQEGMGVLCLAVLAVLWAVLAIAWIVTRDPAGDLAAQCFWLQRGRGMDAEGPFTVAQIVSLWQAGQITTEGMVCADGGEKWLPLAPLAPMWDASLHPKGRGPLARNGGALLLLGLILLLFVPPLGALLAVIGLVLWIVGRSM